jgi:sugar lactone lactonase YvrE
MKKLILPFLFLMIQNLNSQTVTTIAGSGVAGFANGIGTAAQFNNPSRLAIANDGTIFVADALNNRIRKITTAGVVTTYAGTGFTGTINGMASAATFYRPSGVTVATDGTVYVADQGNNIIRKITAAGVTTTLAGSGFAAHNDGIGVAADFDAPSSLAVNADGTVFVADADNNCIRKITAAAVVTTFAGSGLGGSANGTGTAAQFSDPFGLALATDGTIYVADALNNRIRKITAAGVVTNFAGSGALGGGSSDGIATVAQFNFPTGVAVASDGSVYVADSGNHKIRKITAAGVVSTIGGSGVAGFADGVGTAAQFNFPSGVAVATDGTVYVTDSNNHRIRKITNTLETDNFQMENKISVYPNPATNTINIQFSEVINKIIIFDFTGKKVIEQTSEQTIDVSSLAKGIYILQATSGDKNYNAKFIKE